MVLTRPLNLGAHFSLCVKRVKVLDHRVGKYNIECVVGNIMQIGCIAFYTGYIREMRGNFKDIDQAYSDIRVIVKTHVDPIRFRPAYVKNGQWQCARASFLLDEGKDS
jgi:hypothetical protein